MRATSSARVSSAWRSAVAAATATLPGLDDEQDDLSVSCKPDALVLFNPVFDNGPGGYGFDRVGEERYREISPLHNISAETPPAIVFLGTEDKLIPVATAEKFKAEMEAAGRRCDLYLYECCEARSGSCPRADRRRG